MFASNTSHSAEQLDAQFNYVTMLLPGNGTNGAQNNTFLDASTNNFTITRNGNTTQGSFSPYGDNWSNYFDGSSYLSLATATSLGTGNVTVEFWFYPTDISATYYALYEGRSTAATNTGLGIFQYGQTIEIYGNGLKVSSAASAFTANTWTHFAVVRTSGTCQIYINGVASGSSASYSDNFTSTTRRIGQNAAGLNTYTGYISNVREVTSALYSGTFTPSTTPLTAVSGTALLTCQSNRFIDNSSNAFAITVNGNPSVQRFSPFAPTAAYSAATIGGSGYFDGVGDYVYSDASSALDISTGNFTMEAWVYYTSRPTSNVISINSGSGVSGIYFLHGANPAVYITSNGSSWDIMSQDISAYLPLNCWNHAALVRNGNTWTIYVNGVSVYSTTNSSSISINNQSASVGATKTGGQPTFGYITDARVVKGTAVYTANFTPPTAPLTAIANTSVLFNFQNAAIIDNAMMNDLETVGNAQISTSVKKYGTGSLAFDGSGDYLRGPSNPYLGFGTGDFTVEFWLYENTTTGFQYILQINDFANGFWVYKNTGSTKLVVGVGSADIITQSSTPSLSTWNHYAIVRSGSTVTLYYNGSADGSATSSASVNGGQVWIGTYNALGLVLNGYIDDLRITKGVARYTANFTPPTAAFPTN